MEHEIFLSSKGAYGWDSGGGDRDELKFEDELVLGGYCRYTNHDDGCSKKAEDVEAGDAIIDWSDEASKYLQVSHISSIRKRTVEKVIKVTTESGKSVTVSPTHGFYLTVEDELFIEDIKVGESKIWVKDGNHKVWDTVVSLEPLYGKIDVYTFTVPGLRNYISNEIISHNSIGGGGLPQSVTQNLNLAKITTLSLTSGTKYGRIKRSYSAFASQDDGTNGSDRLFEIQFDLDLAYQFTSLNSGVEINSVGIQANKSDEKVFRVDLSSTTDPAGVPMATLLGGMNIDYFIPRYSTADGGATDPVYGGYILTLIGMKGHTPLTR